jgi:hypothetical protein
MSVVADSPKQRDTNWKKGVLLEDFLKNDNQQVVIVSVKAVRAGLPLLDYRMRACFPNQPREGFVNHADAPGWSL